MAFPWSRRDSTAEPLPGDRRSRTRGRRVRQEEARRESSRATRERVHQRWAFAIGGGLVLVIVSILAFGVYQEFYQPPRAWAGSVRNVEFTMGDLVKRIRVLQQLTGQVDLSTVPFEYLRNLLDAEVLRQASPGLGITLTDADIDEALKAQFYPQPEPEQQADPGQLDREFQNNYQVFLTITGLSKQDYRVIVEEQLALAGLRAALAPSEDPQEQVEVEWIRVDRESGISAEEVRNRLENQDFTTVANDVGIPQGFADANGYVGWVPRQTFPELDELLYGDEERGTEPLPVGEISDPVFTVNGIYIIRKLSGPEEQPLTEPMRNKLSLELVVDWQRQQLIRGSEAGWVKVKFDSKWYAWVAEQVRISARPLPPSQGGR
jgi:parvulin-like peptidyl-prolyl isomerase